MCKSAEDTDLLNC